MLFRFFRKVFFNSAVVLDKKRMPQHVAVIMDGNGRWATRKGLPRVAGHRMGAEALKRTITACGDLGIGYLTVYAFSTENWERPKNEVDFLMSLFSENIDNQLDELMKNNIRIRFLGRLKSFPEDLQGKMLNAMDRTRGNTALNVNIMVNYGGRAEITDAVNKIRDGRREMGDEKKPIDEMDISDNLYTAGIPDPDLLIRTAYERRISNFLLWQIAYSELYFTRTLWPDFDKDELMLAVADYQKRQRKFGKI
jgi:undecaprenyl diphosphate synthase